MTARLVALFTLVAVLSTAPGARAEDGWRWPVEGRVVTHYRNGEDPYAAGQHRGIDIAAPAGARVRAARSGTVTFFGAIGRSGLTVSVRTSDGRFDTSYLHLAAAAVGRGDRVHAGDTIGTVGTSGRGSVAEPHLHLGVRAAGERHAYRDPLTLLPPPPPPAEPRPAPRTVPAPAPGTPPAPLPARAAAPALPAPALPALAPAPALAAPALPLTPAPALAAPALPALPTAPALSAPSRALVPPYLGLAPRAAATPLPQPAVRRPPHGGHLPSSVDLGWLAACAGLVSAAMLLGRPRGPLGTLRRARSFAAVAIRPARERA
jgi:murein DD-endopeptidase MepM/ murein hydrolase activator NlpD